MKNILIFAVLIFPLTFLNAQDSNSDDPIETTKLKVDNSFKLHKRSIKFIKVINDSRCPLKTTCIWEGQAKVLVGIYKKGVLKEEKEIIFGAEGISPQDPKEIADFGCKKIFGYSLSPYPSSSLEIKPSDYYMELLVK